MHSLHSTQLATGKAIAGAREVMVAEWSEWLTSRKAGGRMPEALVERKLRLVIDVLIEMLGPLRREANLIWPRVMEQYGRIGASRGLAAGEVVEEIQQLRVLLIRHVGDTIAAMRPRRSVAVFLRLNAIIDRGIAEAVVGYTDVLVASLLPSEPDSTSVMAESTEALVELLDEFDTELARVTAGH
ncbi:MAG TPA: hypothetical protein VFN22_11800 [Gemmatimonadales bacterium]|nr:hypothetical protein [Gemmatimonadales bacterium]